MKDFVTIVIPTKNEECYILNTLASLNRQIGIQDVDVIIADGGSSDRTVEILTYYQNSYKFNLHIVKGGTAASGRNKGADYIKKPYILFLDADTTIDDRATIMSAYYKILTEGNLLIACKTRSRDGGLSSIAFKLFEWCHVRMKEPFCTGVFFFTSREAFETYGKFDESVKHTEDYLLSRKYPKSRFSILNLFVTQDSRRFKKTGYIGFFIMLIKNYINRNNVEYFKKDIGYW